MKYFVCYRSRATITLAYVKTFMKITTINYYTNKQDAYAEMRRNFYDDCDYAVMSIDATGNIDFTSSRQLN